MKTAIKIINLASISLFSLIVGISAWVFTYNTQKGFSEIESLNPNFKYSYIFIAVYILTLFLTLICLTSFIMNTLKNDKISRFIQQILHIINIIFVFISIIFYLIVLVEIENNLFSELNLKIDAKFEYFYYNIPFYLVLIQSICNLILSSLSLKYTNFDNQNKNMIENSVIAPSTEFSKIRQEIEEMKQEIELKNLKEEYLSLYKQIHDDKKS